MATTNDLPGTARIQVSRKRNLPAKARVLVTQSRSITGTSRLRYVAQQSISGTSRIKVTNSRSIGGTAFIRVATIYAGIGSVERALAIRPDKTLSQLIEAQLPGFIREQYPAFISFLTTYYQWLEQNGAEIYTAKVIAVTPNTVTFPSDASTSITEYLGKYVVVLNGNAKGYTRQIVGYDPSSFIATVDTGWDSVNVPAPNTLMSIRDRAYPDRLLDYRDIDNTLDQFIQHFRNTFISRLPGSIIANPRLVLKHFKEFNQARGTEDSYRFLFRILFGQEIEFYYPRVDVFRPSAARWIKTSIMRMITDDPFDWTSRQIVGSYSGATAVVESAVQITLNELQVTELTLSSVRGQFLTSPYTDAPEIITITYPFVPPAQTVLGAYTDLLEPSSVTQLAWPYYICTAITIVDPGTEYEVGDLVVGMVERGSNIQGTVTDIFFTTYNGRLVTTAYNLNANQVALAPQESSADGFFVGCQITITAGTGIGQSGIALSYDGTLRVVTLNTAFDIAPDISSEYTIIRNRGGIKSIQVTEVGCKVVQQQTTMSVVSTNGNGAVLTPVIGMIGAKPGYWTSSFAGSFKGLHTSPDSFASSNKVIQDSFYYQDFSYEIRFTEPIDSYRDVVNAVLHPAGLKLFGAVSDITSAVNAKPLTCVAKKIIQVETRSWNAFDFNPRSELLSGNVEHVLECAGHAHVVFTPHLAGIVIRERSIVTFVPVVASTMAIAGSSAVIFNAAIVAPAEADGVATVTFNPIVVVMVTVQAAATVVFQLPYFGFDEEDSNVAGFDVGVWKPN